MPEAVAAPAIERKSTSKFVTIACKIGLPWIDLTLCEPEEKYENTQTGPRKITEWKRTGQTVRIRGTAYPRGQAPDNFPDKPEMAIGYALTHNVPRDFWDAWKEQHKRAPYITSEMIFAADGSENVKAQAKEHNGEMSGLEPIQRAKDSLGQENITDPRASRSMHRNVSSVEPGVHAA